MIPQFLRHPVVRLVPVLLQALERQRVLRATTAASYADRLTMSTDLVSTSFFPMLLCFPRSTADVASCPSGGGSALYVADIYPRRRTGTNGRALNRGIIVDMSLADRIIEINPEEDGCG